MFRMGIIYTCAREILKRKLTFFNPVGAIFRLFPRIYLAFTAISLIFNHLAVI